MSVQKNEIINNEIELMNHIVSQCNKETFIDGGRASYGEIINHYELPSGLHVYSSKGFSLANIYDKSIDLKDEQTSFTIVSKPIDRFSQRINDRKLWMTQLDNMASEQKLARIEYRNVDNTPLITYSVENKYIDSNRV